MSKRFDKSKKYVFTTKKFCKDMRMKTNIWVKKCNGREVKIISDFNGTIGDFMINANWCKEVKKKSLNRKRG